MISSLQALFVMAAASTAIVVDDFPPFNTAEWQALFAVDPAAAELEASPIPAPENATTYSVTFKGEIAGFDVGRIFLDISSSPDAYAVDYRMEQRGVARWFSDAEASTHARGLYDDDGDIASHYYYNHDYERDDDQQYVQLYRPMGERRMHLWTSPQYSFHESVTEDLALDSVDPMGALMSLGFPEVDAGQSPCDRTQRVFDGRRLFDLVMTDNGEDWIRRGGSRRYEGYAYKCRLEQFKVAGYREKDSGDIQGDLWVYLADVPEEFRTDTFAYVPVMIIARRGWVSARLEGKDPIITAADGRSINLGEREVQRRPGR